MYSKKERVVLTIITLLSIAITIGMMFIDPMSQDLHYHNFADKREIFSISNFWNVVSNFPYFVIGLYGLYKLLKQNSLNIVEGLKPAYIFFFIGVTLVAFGSSYYHLNPNNETLLWDRLPMTIAFMALFSFIMAEFLSPKLGKAVLFPLLLLGMASVFYWFFGELKGEGDLRAYAIVQFLPMIIMPLMFLFFKPTFNLISGYWYLLLCYLIAKVFEAFDLEIYHLLEVISGHSLKHFISAFGVYILIRTFEKRVTVK